MISNDNVGYKYLSPNQLTQALNKVPEGSMISVNGVGNLCVADNNNIYIGYIDFFDTGDFIPNDVE